MESLKKFWTFMIQNPKVFVSTIAVAVIQIAKLKGFNLNLSNEFLDAITALIGLFGLIFSAKGSWPEGKV